MQLKYLFFENIGESLAENLKNVEGNVEMVENNAESYDADNYKLYVSPCLKRNGLQRRC